MVFPRGLSFSSFILFIYQVIWNVCVLAHFLLAAIGKAQHYGGCYFHKRLSHSDYGIILGLKIVVLPSMTTIPYTAVRVVYRKESVARLCCSSHLKSLYMRWCRPPHYSLFNSTRKKERKNDDKFCLFFRNIFWFFFYDGNEGFRLADGLDFSSSLSGSTDEMLPSFIYFIFSLSFTSLPYRLVYILIHT